MQNNKSASGYNYIPCFFLLIKSIEYLNFRHFRHFAILGISWGNLIVSQKDLATKCIKIITKVLSAFFCKPFRPIVRHSNKTWLYRKSKYKECGSGFQPRNQMPRLKAASTKIYPK
jgi:hypothetical protein